MIFRVRTWCISVLINSKGRRHRHQASLTGQRQTHLESQPLNTDFFTILSTSQKRRAHQTTINSLCPISRQALPSGQNFAYMWTKAAAEQILSIKPGREEAEKLTIYDILPFNNIPLLLLHIWLLYCQTPRLSSKLPSVCLQFIPQEGKLNIWKGKSNSSDENVGICIQRSIQNAIIGKNKKRSVLLSPEWKSKGLHDDS